MTINFIESTFPKVINVLRTVKVFLNVFLVIKYFLEYLCNTANYIKVLLFTL